MDSTLVPWECRPAANVHFFFGFFLKKKKNSLRFLNYLVDTTSPAEVGKRRDERVLDFFLVLELWLDDRGNIVDWETVAQDRLDVQSQCLEVDPRNKGLVKGCLGPALK